MSTSEAIRERLQDLQETTAAIDAQVEAGDALPALVMARVLVEVDSYAACLARCLDAMQMARPKVQRAEPARSK